MKRFLLALAGCFAAAMPFVSGQQKNLDIFYAGTFSERGSEGIYVFQFDRRKAELTELQTIPGKKSPSYLEIHPGGKYLYAVYREGMTANDENGTVAAFRIDPATGKLSRINERSSEGAGPCHVSLDAGGDFVFISNYGGGNLAVYPVESDGSLGIPVDVVQHEGSSVNPGRQQAPHVHSAIPSENGRFLYVSDLGTDKINIYKISRRGKLIPAKIPFIQSKPGSGPRHFALQPGGNYAYSAEELSSTVAAYKVDKKTGALELMQRMEMLSPASGFKGQNSAADIHVSPDSRFLYASNRGQDNLVIYAIDPESGSLSLTGHEDSRGGHPRNFHIDSKGEFIFVANRDNDNIVVFKRDLVSGKLSYTGEEARVPAVVCIKQISYIFE